MWYLPQISELERFGRMHTDDIICRSLSVQSRIIGREHGGICACASRWWGPQPSLPNSATKLKPIKPLISKFSECHSSWLRPHKVHYNCIILLKLTRNTMYVIMRKSRAPSTVLTDVAMIGTSRTSTFSTCRFDPNQMSWVFAGFRRSRFKLNHVVTSATQWDSREIADDAASTGTLK